MNRSDCTSCISTTAKTLSKHQIDNCKIALWLSVGFSLLGLYSTFHLFQNLFQSLPFRRHFGHFVLHPNRGFGRAHTPDALPVPRHFPEPGIGTERYCPEAEDFVLWRIFEPGWNMRDGCCLYARLRHWTTARSVYSIPTSARMRVLWLFSHHVLFYLSRIYNRNPTKELVTVGFTVSVLSIV